MMQTNNYFLSTILVGVALHFFSFLSAQNNLLVSVNEIISGTATYDSVIIESGGVLTLNGSLTVNQALLLKNGGRITHGNRFMEGLTIDCLGTIEIQGSASITVDGNGLLGGYAGQTGVYGETFGADGQIVRGSAPGNNQINPGWGGAGGTHGGRGGSGRPDIPPGSAYGSVEQPALLGSGGGGSPCGSCNRKGASGGGRIRIMAANLILNGLISANGDHSVANADIGGGGSGGSVWVEVGSISGTGVIRANGGLGRAANFYHSGAGGGGRVALYFDSSTLPDGNIQAYGGGQYYAGAAGTVYLKKNTDPSGKLIIDNNQITGTNATVLRLDDDTDFKTVILKRKAQLEVVSNDTLTLEVVEPVLVDDAQLVIRRDVALVVANANGTDLRATSGAVLQFDPGSVIHNIGIQLAGSTLRNYTDLAFSSGDQFLMTGQSTLQILDSAAFTIPAVDQSNFQAGTIFIAPEASMHVLSKVVSCNLRMIKDGRFGADDRLDKLIIGSGGELTHSGRYLPGLVLNVDQVEIRPNGKINADGKGLWGGYRASFEAYGETFNSNGEIVPGAGPGINTIDPGWGGAGATYGGQGGAGRPDIVPNAAYGSIENPVWLGSGGGGSPCGNCNRTGANGGGRITINAKTLLLDGLISASGNASASNATIGGGGSGGSVLIHAAAISGSGLIRANGGQGTTINFYKSGAGGGGRIALYYDNLELPGQSIQAFGGRQRYPGAAGTIFLKEGTHANGQVIIDNGGVVTTALTPYVNDDHHFEQLTIRNKAILELPTAFEVPTWNIVLEDGTITQPDSIRLSEMAVLSGTGSIKGNLINGGTIAPGSAQAIGHLALHGALFQLEQGRVVVKLAAVDDPSSHDLISVDSTAFLDGTLEVSFLDNFMPFIGNRFVILRSADRKHDFLEVHGWGDFGTLYEKTKVSLVRNFNYTENSTTDPVIVLSPSGVIRFGARLLDHNGNPVVVSDNIWLDFSEVEGLNPCDTEFEWPEVYPTGLSDSLGNISFYSAVGGCPKGNLRVLSSHGLIAEVPIRSLDHNGGLVVTAADFVYDSCNDYNNDQLVDYADWDFMSKYLHESCLTDISEYLILDLKTYPGEESVFQGDTIQVCATITNTLNERVNIDSIHFNSAFWGIARPFNRFDQSEHFVIESLQTIEICKQFIVPPTGHGCVQAEIYPSLYYDPADFPQVTDSLVYGFRTEDDHSIAYIGLSSGIEFVSVAHDTTYREEMSSLKFLGMEPSGLKGLERSGNAYWVNLLRSNPARAAANLAGQNLFPIAAQDTLIYKLSVLFDFFRSFAKADQLDFLIGKTNYLEKTNCPQNGCGAQSGPFAGINFPEYDFRECCNEHDLCYCNPNCTNDQKLCDFKMWECILEKHNDDAADPKLTFGTRERIASNYYWGLRIAGRFAFNNCKTPKKSKQRNYNPKRRTTIVPSPLLSADNPFVKDFSTTLADTQTEFEIPVGTVGGTQLTLVVQAFLPDSWAYQISHDTVINSGDTLVVTIEHPDFIHCVDTGSVVIYAYTAEDEFAGYAEVAVYDASIKGDADNNGIVDTLDIAFLDAFTLGAGDKPVILEAVELNGDLAMDIADLTRLVALVQQDDENFDCRRDTIPLTSDISGYSQYHGDTTWISISTPFDLAGLQLQFEGADSMIIGQPALLEGFEASVSQAGKESRLNFFDRHGQHTIPAGDTTIIKVPGEFILLSGQASDRNHKSWSVNIISLPPAKPEIIVAGSLSFCQGDSVLLAGPDGFQSYTWSTGDTLASITIYSPGSYSLIVESSFGANASSDTLSVQVLPNPPIPEIEISGDTLLAPLATAYKWFLDDLPILSATQQFYHPTRSGVFKVAVTDENGCTSVSDTLAMVISIVSALPVEALKVFPNPTRNNIMVQFQPTFTLRQFKWRITDMRGLILLESKPRHVSTYFSESINLDFLSEGTYVLRLTAVGKESTFRFVVAR